MAVSGTRTTSTADGKKGVSIATYPNMPGGTRLNKNDRADILMTNVGEVNFFVEKDPTSFERGFMIESNYKIAVGYTKDNKDLGKALLASRRQLQFPCQ